MLAWTIDRTGTDCFRCQWDKADGAFESYALLTSDHHVDNKHCNHALLRNHLDTAMEIGAPVFVWGDTFCAMQGKWDKRADTAELIPELQGGNYLDRLVDFATEFYRPYAKNIAIISNGNHEDSIEKRHQTDLTERLASNLRSIGGVTMRGQYMGFVGFGAKIEREGRGYNPSSWSRSLCWHHGYGGGGEVTRGLIDNNRTRSQYFADIFYSGHIHRRNEEENVIVSLDQRSGQIVRRTQLFLRGGAYKDDSQSRWQIQRGQAARPMGGYWLRFRVFRERKGSRVVDITPIKATWGKP